MKNLIQVHKADLQKNYNDDWDYLFVFIEKIGDIFYDQPEIRENLTDQQMVLLAYNTLYGQVCNGGFVQLIYNGYGGMIFETPFIEQIENWGAEKIADISKRAKKIYDEKKQILEVEGDLEEFAQLYGEVPEFEALDDEFYTIMDDETTIIRKYVENNLEAFAEIT